MAEEELGWKALSWAWDHWDEVRERLGKIRSWFKSDPGRGILIIGAGGVGKSTLARILSGEFDWLLDEPWRYKADWGIVEYALEDDPKTTIAVPPGQPNRREVLWIDVERNLMAGQYRGVIVVNAYGYHTFGNLTYKQHPLYEGSKERFLTTYLEACRQDEVKIISQIIKPMILASGKMWLLTVVAKEDLWLPDGKEVRRFYTEGAYEKAISAVSTAKDVVNFRSELMYTSLIISNFEAGEGEFLKKNIEGYDHRRHVESIRGLLEAVNSLREWEAGS